MPVIGQGTWKIEDDASAVEALRLGLDLGLGHIDTAEMYGGGRAERVVAQALAGRRAEVFLVSKVLPSNASYEGTLRACERSLHRLETDRLDLYLLHWPSGHPIRETMRAMAELVDRGMTRYIGVSNFDVEELREAERACTGVRIACNQVLYHLGARGIERRLIPYCEERGIAVVGYSPFGQGSFPPAGSPGGRVLAAAARRHGRTPRQAALNFLARRAFLIPKSGRPEHVKENAGASGWDLSEEDAAAIDRAFPAPARAVPLGML